MFPNSFLSGVNYPSLTCPLGVDFQNLPELFMQQKHQTSVAFRWPKCWCSCSTIACVPLNVWWIPLPVPGNNQGESIFYLFLCYLLFPEALSGSDSPVMSGVMFILVFTIIYYNKWVCVFTNSPFPPSSPKENTDKWHIWCWKEVCIWAAVPQRPSAASLIKSKWSVPAPRRSLSWQMESGYRDYEGSLPERQSKWRGGLSIFCQRSW